MFVHAQAPVRIGIAGGGTDLPTWTRERVGYCLNIAVAMYAHAVAIERSDGQVVASYTRLDRASCITEIANELIRESALLHGLKTGFEVHILSEVSSHGSGLGVSSSIAVALAALFAQMQRRREGHDGSRADRLSVQFVAEDAWTVEIDRLRRPIGRQDHMAAAYGGLRLYAFEGSSTRVDRTFSSEDAVWLAQHLVLLVLPGGHDASTILSGVRDPNQLQAAYDAVPVAVEAIARRDLRAIGCALAMGQRSKVGILGAVTTDVDAIVRAVEAVPGVYGSKVAGAGGGGHLVVACDLESVEGVRQASRLPLRCVVPDTQGVRSSACA